MAHKMLRSNRIAAMALVACAMILLSVAYRSLTFNNTSTAEGIDVGAVHSQGYESIPPSPAVEMVIPAINMRASFETDPCRVKSGAINPATMNLACTYTAADRPYSLPGTDAPDLTVIAGHTGAGVPGVFNGLYDAGSDQHSVPIGAQLFIKTQASGDHWLVYRATDVHSPDKQALGEDETIWGSEAMPGRLLTISCIQPLNPLAASVKNAVVGWQFEGVSATDAA